MGLGPRGLAIRRLISAGADLLSDLLLGLLIGLALSLTPVGTFFASRAVVMLRIGTPGSLWKGPVPMLMGIAGTFVYSLPLAFVIVATCKPVARRRSWRRAFIGATPWLGLTAALLLGSWRLALIFSIAAPFSLVYALSSRLAQFPG